MIDRLFSLRPQNHMWGANVIPSCKTLLCVWRKRATKPVNYWKCSISAASNNTHDTKNRKFPHLKVSPLVNKSFPFLQPHKYGFSLRILHWRDDPSNFVFPAPVQSTATVALHQYRSGFTATSPSGPVRLSGCTPALFLNSTNVQKK